VFRNATGTDHSVYVFVRVLVKCAGSWRFHLATPRKSTRAVLALNAF